MIIQNVLRELKEHSPFTLFGAMTGVLFMMIFKDIPHEVSYRVFYVLHPMHVFFSAVVTTAVYCRYHTRAKQDPRGHLWKILLIGYLGSVGIGTLSDSLIPFLGERVLGMHHAEAHIGFIEKWWLVNPMAIAGIVLAYFYSWSKFPHAVHVLLSTWASLFHMFMAHDHHEPALYFGVFVFLFLAVWLPCCLSDIVFPLVFVKEDCREEHCCGCR